MLLIEIVSKSTLRVVPPPETRREIEAADRDRHVVRRHAVHRNRARSAADEVDRDAGQEFQEIADIALEHGAEFVGRDDVDDVRREPLLVDRDGGAVHFLRGERRPTSRESARRCCRDRSRDGRLRPGVTATVALAVISRPVKNTRTRASPGGHVRQPILAAGVGEGFEGRAFDRDPRALDIVSRAGVGDAAFNRAGLARFARVSSERMPKKLIASRQSRVKGDEGFMITRG